MLLWPFLEIESATLSDHAEHLCELQKGSLVSVHH